MLTLRRGFIRSSRLKKNLTPLLSLVDTRNYHVTRPNFNLHQNTKKEKVIESKKNTITDVVEKDYGLSKFVKKSYMYTLGGITVFLTGGTTLALTLPPDILMTTAVVGAVGSLISIFPLTMIKGEITDTEEFVNGKKITYPILKDDTRRNLAYGGIVLGTTTAISPLMQFALATDPLAIAMATGGALGIMGGSTYYANSLKPGELNFLGPPLMGGLLGLVGMNIIGLGFAWYGNYDVFNVIHHVDLYGGLVLFTALQAYDTHQMIEMYTKERKPDHLIASINFYLNFLNLFRRILEIYAKANKNR